MVQKTKEKYGGLIAIKEGPKCWRVHSVVNGDKNDVLAYMTAFFVVRPKRCSICGAPVTSRAFGIMWEARDGDVKEYVLCRSCAAKYLGYLAEEPPDLVCAED